MSSQTKWRLAFEMAGGLSLAGELSSVVEQDGWRPSTVDDRDGWRSRGLRFRRKLSSFGGYQPSHRSLTQKTVVGPDRKHNSIATLNTCINQRRSYSAVAGRQLIKLYIRNTCSRQQLNIRKTRTCTHCSSQ